MNRMNGIVGVIVASVAVLIVVLVGWFMFVSPQRSKADTLSTQVTAAQAELAADQVLLSPKVRKETEANARAARLALPDQAEVSNILRQLNTFAKQSRTELDNITPAAPFAAGGAMAIPISLNFKGRYFGLQKLLQLLQQSANVKNGQLQATGRLYSVDSIQFTGSQTAAPTSGGTSTSTPTSTGDITATIALNAYMYSGGVTAPVATPTTTTASASAATP